MNGKGNLSVPNKMAYGEFTAVLLRSKHRIFSNFLESKLDYYLIGIHFIPE